MKVNEERINQLISQLTLEEKVGMCHGAGLFRTEGIKRLNIPPLKMADGPMGVRHEFPDDSWVPIGNNDDFVTYLPCNAALASTWSKDLAHLHGSILGNEARGRGKDVILGPGINMVRSPLCGRNFEYMSEDPYLTGQLAIDLVKGIQEDNDVASCVKHFAVNNQETERLNYEAKIDERTLREIYLPAFEAVVKEGKAHSIMPAYNKLFGYHCAHNKRLLQDILQDEWGFDGITISDWGAVSDTKEAAEAGLDIDMNVTYNFDEYYFAKPLIRAVREGEISEEVVDAKVRRILRLMYKLNMFSGKRKRGTYNSPEHREGALKIARESVVLLKNDNSTLPLNYHNIKKLAVIGRNADLIQSNGGGSAEIKALYEITPLIGIKMRLGGNTEVKYAQGYDNDPSKKADLIKEAVTVAKECDAVVVVGGLTHKAEELELEQNALVVSKDEEIKKRVDSEGYDRSDLILPYNQDELISEVLKVNPNTVVVMLTGSPVNMNEWIDEAPAVVQTWYNGMEGGTALAEILFGDINPSGKLPVTFPKKLEDCPAHTIGEFPGGKTVNYAEGIFIGYRYFSTKKIDPLFCFGYGLSYTKFKYDDLKLQIDENLDNVEVTVKFKVTNVGDVAGAEAAQVYVNDVESSVERPEIELKGFEKLYLEPGETKEAEIKLNNRAFAFYDVNSMKWLIESGKFKVMVGSSCQDIRLQGDISIESNHYFN